MTRFDVTVGVAAAVLAVAAVGAFLLVVAAGRADRRARHADRAERAAAVDAVLERFTTPAGGVHREPPTVRVPAQYSAPPTEAMPARSPHSTPIDPARAEQLLAEIDEALAASAGAAGVEAASACCVKHYAPECRRVAVCCGACPTLPVS